MHCKPLPLMLSVAFLAVPVCSAIADVTETSLRRDIQLFGTISIPGEDVIFETVTEEFLEAGEFNERAELLLTEGEFSASSEGIQFSQVTPDRVFAQGAIYSLAESNDPLAFVEAFSSTRIFYEFMVDEPTPLRLDGFIAGNGDGRVSMTLVGPDGVVFNYFVVGDVFPLNEAFLLEPGAYNFSFVVGGFAQRFDETETFATGTYAWSMDFDDVTAVEGAPTADLSPRTFPNPATTEMEIRWAGLVRSSETVSIVDASGRSVRQLASSSAPGATTGSAVMEHRASWDLKDSEGNAVPAGVYYVRTNSSDPVKTVVLR